MILALKAALAGMLLALCAIDAALMAVKPDLIEFLGCLLSGAAGTALAVTLIVGRIP